MTTKEMLFGAIALIIVSALGWYGYSSGLFKNVQVENTLDQDKMSPEEYRAVGGNRDAYQEETSHDQGMIDDGVLPDDTVSASGTVRTETGY